MGPNGKRVTGAAALSIAAAATAIAGTGTGGDGPTIEAKANAGFREYDNGVVEAFWMGQAGGGSVTFKRDPKTGGTVVRIKDAEGVRMERFPKADPEKSTGSFRRVGANGAKFVFKSDPPIGVLFSKVQVETLE